MKEYLEALDENDKPAKRLSVTDPAARWTAAMAGPANFSYSTNYLIDIDAGIIMDVEATPAYRTAEVDSTKTMINRVEEKNGLLPQRLIGDTAYGTAELLGWMVDEKNIEPHIPLWDKTQRKDGSLSSSEFTYDSATDIYICPAGKSLNHGLGVFKRKRSGITKANTKIYRAAQSDCQDCTFKSDCCPNTESRKIHRSVNEEARDVARAVAETDAYKKSRDDRKKVEMLFAHMKRILKVDRLRLRGPKGAHDEFVLTATAQNLRRLAKWVGASSENQRAMMVK